jgi:hypothetical protein
MIVRWIPATALRSLDHEMLVCWIQLADPFWLDLKQAEPLLQAGYLQLFQIMEEKFVILYKGQLNYHLIIFTL